MLHVSEKAFIDGKTLKDMFLKSFDLFSENFETINAINVFPVPDGDTGLNMLETLRAIKNELETINDSSTCGEVIRKISYGAFNGSVGNSGIIFSEYLHGLEKAWTNLDVITCLDLKNGLKLASEAAYKSIDNPKEGTILTVQRKVSEHVNNDHNTIDNPYLLLINAFNEAKTALLETHFILSDANKAKTIDAGALGFVLIFEGFLSAVFDDDIFSILTTRTLSGDILPFLNVDIEKLVMLEQAWEVQFNVDTIKKSVEMVRNALKKEGECLVITYDPETPDYKVHIHIKKPVNDFLKKTKRLFGEVRNIRILDLKSQNEEFIQLLSNK